MRVTFKEVYVNASNKQGMHIFKRHRRRSEEKCVSERPSVCLQCPLKALSPCTILTVSRKTLIETVSCPITSIRKWCSTFSLLKSIAANVLLSWPCSGCLKLAFVPLDWCAYAGHLHRTDVVRTASSMSLWYLWGNISCSSYLSASSYEKCQRSIQIQLNILLLLVCRRDVWGNNKANLCSTWQNWLLLSVLASYVKLVPKIQFCLPQEF